MRLRLPLLLLLLTTGGCSLLAPAPEPLPPVGPQLPPQPVTTPPPAEVTPPQPAMPAPAPQPQPEVVKLPPKVAVVLTSRADAYESVAVALAGMLEDAEVYDLSDRSLLARDAFDAIHASGASAVVAVGLRAAIYARNFADVPVVFSQVFNVAENELFGDDMHGVSALPPLEQQLRAWLEVGPELRNIGAIVGPGHEELFAEAERAAGALGLGFHGKVAQSDRETLYLFSRMTQQVDAFWLFPDNRILSAAVLREMFDLAAKHGVQVTVFNESLLDLGATLSATTDEEDIARTVHDILQRVLAGDTETLPRLAPLSEVRIQLNGHLQERLQFAEGQPSGGAQ